MLNADLTSSRHLIVSSSHRLISFTAPQGKLVEDFASLLKSLWSQEYLCVFPSKFKRGLIKYKPQFAGNEQQDSQVMTGCCAVVLMRDMKY